MAQLYKTFTIAEIAHIRKLKFDVGRAEHYEVLERNKKTEILETAIPVKENRD